MATVPTGYIFYDVSASRSYAAGKTMPTLANGDYLVPATSNKDGYYNQYSYYTSYSDWVISFSDGWSGSYQSGYGTSTVPDKPFNSIGDKPVRFFNYNGAGITSVPDLSSNTNLLALIFYNCSKLTTLSSANYLPSSLTSFAGLFYMCTALTTIPDSLSSFSNVLNANSMFCNCSNLVNGTTLPNSIFDCRSVYRNCTSLTNAGGYINIPTSATDAGWMFAGCENLINSPEITVNGSTYEMFLNCSSLAGLIYFTGESINFTNMFKGTTERIYLLGAGADDNIASTSTLGNVYNGFKAKLNSFTCIRCDTPEGHESVTGRYVKLTITFTAPHYSGVNIIIPTLKKDNEELENPITWYLNTIGGTEITSSGVEIPQSESGSLIAVYDLGSENGSGSFSFSMKTKYSNYDWETKTTLASLTYSDFIIDINPQGNGITFGEEAPIVSPTDHPKGLFTCAMDAEFNGSEEYGSFAIGGRARNFEDGQRHEKGNFDCYMHPTFYTMAGEIKLWAGATIPNGWLVCDGSEISKTTYPNLYEAIGDLWGVPNSSSNFKLPNLNGKVPVGYDSSDTDFDTVGKTGGAATHTLTAAQIPAHTHGSAGAHTHSINNCSAAGSKASQLESYEKGNSKNRSISTNSAGAHTHTSVGGGEAHNNLQPYAVVKYIICAI